MRDHLFHVLRSAGVGPVRIHVRITAVFGAANLIPQRRRLPSRKLDLDDRLDTLQPTFPRGHQPDRRSVLFGQGLAIETRNEDGQLVHGLVEPQGFEIGPGVMRLGPDPGHFSEPVSGHHAHVPRLGFRIDLFDQRRDGETGPGHGHRPRLNAAHPVETFLQRETPHEVVEVIVLGIVDQPFDFPRVDGEAIDHILDALLIKCKFVEIIDARGGGLGRDRPIQLVLGIALGRIEALVGAGSTQGIAQQRAQPRETRGLQQRAAIEVERFRGSFSLRNFPPSRNFDQHASSPCGPRNSPVAVVPYLAIRETHRRDAA